MHDDDATERDAEDVDLGTCAAVRPLLGELIDDALDTATQQSVYAHLDCCSDCSLECEQLRMLNASLDDAFAESRLQASSLADRVLLANGEEGAMSNRTSWSGVGRRAVMGIAALAAACLVFAVAPSFRNSPVDEQRLAEMDVPSDHSVDLRETVDVVPVAHLVRSTGRLEYLGPNSNTWEVLAPGDISAFGCPSDSTLRTSEGALCELQTADGATVRLNEKTEISLPTATDVELVSGELWCETSPEKHVNVRAQKAATGNEVSDNRKWTVRCHDTNSSTTVQNDGGCMKVTAAAGNVELTIGETKQSVPAGSTCQVLDGNRVLVATAGDALSAVRWTQPLLAMAGHGNPELKTRVENLLAGVGGTKLSWMRESDLRALGEYAGVPLLEFVKGGASKNEQVKRRKAMAIAADTAPVWTVPEFLALLDDHDAEIRTSAAKALARLTGQSPPTSASTWLAQDGADAEVGREKVSAAEAKEMWRDWWAANSKSCVPGS